MDKHTKVSTSGPAEESAELGEQWIKAFLEGNADAIAGLYALNASSCSFLSPFRVEGREEIRASFAGFLKTFPTRAIARSHLFVQVYDGTVIRTFYFTMTLGDSTGNVKRYHGSSTFVYMVVNEQRVIVAQHSSLLPTFQ